MGRRRISSTLLRAWHAFNRKTGWVPVRMAQGAYACWILAKYSVKKGKRR